MAAMIEARNISMIYRMGAIEVPALRGVSITVDKGEFVGIMGPSGSGKSTLLHIAGLLDRQTDGDLFIEGTDVSRLSERERTLFRLNRLGYVFQDYALVSELTAVENVYLTCLIRKGQEKHCVGLGSSLLDRVGLGPRKDHLQSELSGGEQQRVAVARALVNTPDIILADEPCANLDSENSQVILDLFRKVNRETGQTILMVTHEEWHTKYLNRIIRLRDGLIVD
jgi:putative ABC transport system ATP-binding protein